MDKKITSNVEAFLGLGQDEVLKIMSNLGGVGKGILISNGIMSQVESKEDLANKVYQNSQSIKGKCLNMSKAYDKGISKALKTAIKGDIESEKLSVISESIALSARAEIPKTNELVTAIKHDNREAVKVIIQIVDLANSKGQSPLHYAARLGKNEILYP